MLLKTSKLDGIFFMDYFEENLPLIYFSDMSYIEISRDLRSRLKVLNIAIIFTPQIFYFNPQPQN